MKPLDTMIANDSVSGMNCSCDCICNCACYCGEVLDAVETDNVDISRYETKDDVRLMMVAG